MMYPTNPATAAMHGVAWLRGFDPHGACLLRCTA
jgi:hypothetical protein